MFRYAGVDLFLFFLHRRRREQGPCVSPQGIRALPRSTACPVAAMNRLHLRDRRRVLQFARLLCFPRRIRSRDQLLCGGCHAIRFGLLLSDQRVRRIRCRRVALLPRFLRRGLGCLHLRIEGVRLSLRGTRRKAFRVYVRCFSLVAVHRAVRFQSIAGVVKILLHILPCDPPGARRCQRLLLPRHALQRVEQCVRVDRAVEQAVKQLVQRGRLFFIERHRAARAAGLVPPTGWLLARLTMELANLSQAPGASRQGDHGMLEARTRPAPGRTERIALARQ